MKLQIHSLAVLLFLVEATSLTNGATLASPESMESVIRNVLRYAKKNEDGTCANSAGNLTEILDYIKLGESEIQKPDTKDVVIVLGASGVGKSTLVQFVANSSNTLAGECTVVCTIIDESDTIGDDIISTTFVPNLVVNEERDIPFYDMPGFKDNRAAAIEIANAFFIQKILQDAENIKFVILDRFSSFTTADKQSLKALLKNLADLVKSPEKFEGGIGMIATQVIAVNDEHNRLIEYIADYLTGDLMPQLEDLFDGADHHYVERSRIILQNIVTDDANKGKYLSYFMSPKQDGPILNETRIAENKVELDKFIFETVEFIPTQDADFGLPLSEVAILVLKETGFCVATTLAQQMNTFAADIKTTIQDGLTNAMNGDGTGIGELVDLATNLTSSNFTFEMPLSNFLNQLLNSISNLQTPFLEETKEQIKSAMTFIELIEKTQATILFEPESWVTPITSTITELQVEATSFTTIISDGIKTEIDKFATNIEKYFVENLQNIAGNHPLVDIVAFTKAIENMVKANYTFLDETGDYLFYLERVKQTIVEYGESEATITVKNLESYENILRVVSALGSLVDVVPSKWGKLPIIKSNVVEGVKAFAETLQQSAYSNLVASSEEISNQWLGELSALKDISWKEGNSSELATSMNTSLTNIAQYEANAQSLTEFISQYLTVLKTLHPGCTACSSIPELEALKIFEVLDAFSWNSTDWTSPFKTTIFDPIENEKDLNQFLRALFNDLSLPLLQTGEESSLQSFWGHEKEINEDNFNPFFDLIGPDGFKAHTLFSRDRAKQFVLHMTKGKDRLDALLNLMLADPYKSCPVTKDVVLSGLILSFDRAMECVNRIEQRTSVTLIATHQMFANSRIVGNEINNITNIQLIVMTNSIEGTDGEIVLAGKQGEQGKNGGPAGAQYALYNAIDPTSTIFSSSVDGGNGGAGFKGETGKEGARGQNHFDEKIHCAAWAGGKLQIRGGYDSDCNNETTGSEPQLSYQYCHAGEEGIEIRIKGDIEGTKGETGKQGTQGASGGYSGQSYAIQADKFGDPKVPSNGVQGAQGKGGDGGDGGLGGPRGDTLIKTLDDKGTQRSCQHVEDTPINSDPSADRGDNGDRGPEGPPGNAADSQKTVDSAAVTKHLETLRGLLAGQDNNEFLHLRSQGFLKSIETGTPI